MAVELRTRIEKEILTFCSEILGLLDKHLIPSCTDPDADVENKVFYMKMRGDYYRYLAEIRVGEERSKVAMESKNAYDTALNAAQQLPATNYIRLGLALNFSTYWYDIAGSRHEACKMARRAFDDAIPELTRLDEVISYKETALILQLLRDNLTLWMNEEEEEQERRSKGENQGEGHDENVGQGHGENVGQSQRGYYR
ncbi:14-3-3 protein zeta-like [Lineus longissimus]|uniref:14-3-3 protein zeta-like n=1 Tax=Lineus longissimus TaxID=88925 RepID=UPI00315C785B